MKMRWLPLMAGLLLPGFFSHAAEKAEVTCPLEEVSAYQAIPKRYLWNGQREDCASQPGAAVKRYPAFKSKNPLYGCFAIDGNPLSKAKGLRYDFAIDESGGTGKGYDRLYFDVNRNQDLSDDKPLKVNQEPDSRAVPEWKEVTLVFFQTLNLPVDYGPPTGVKTFPLLPRLTLFPHAIEGRHYPPSLGLVAERARQGKITLADRTYEVTLGQPFSIFGRYDRPYVYMHMQAESGTTTWARFGGPEFLMQAQPIGGALYTFSATPQGDRFTAKPYTGEYGELRLGAGERKLGEMSLHSTKMCSSAMAMDVGSDQGTRNVCKLPVGDYFPEMMSLRYGTLEVELSNNYHSDGKPRDIGDRSPVYGFQIRKDKPFVLDFSNKPEVIFASPGKEATFKPGDKIEVKAVLVDPKLDIMIRRLRDTAKKAPPNAGFMSDLSLDPKVTIRDMRGKVMAEGVMPFG